MIHYFSTRYFVRPPYVASDNLSYLPAKGAKTYSEYNYLKPGIASFLRNRHFEYALRLTKKYFKKCNVIDFGCADGPFLPSLARYFNYVVGIDQKPEFIELARKVVSTEDLRNVKLVCNRDLTLPDVKSEIGDKTYHIVYLLGTLEHIGDNSNLWESRANFVRELFELIDENGLIVLSVPNMIGLPFLLATLGLWLSRAQIEPISVTNFLKASLLGNTAELEKKWQGGHLGFNHKKLEERSLTKHFHILQKKVITFQVIYLREGTKEMLNFQEVKGEKTELYLIPPAFRGEKQDLYQRGAGNI